MILLKDNKIFFRGLVGDFSKPFTPPTNPDSKLETALLNKEFSSTIFDLHNISFVAAKFITNKFYPYYVAYRRTAQKIKEPSDTFEALTQLVTPEKIPAISLLIKETLERIAAFNNDLALKIALGYHNPRQLYNVVKESSPQYEEAPPEPPILRTEPTESSVKNKEAFEKVVEKLRKIHKEEQ